MKANIPSGIRLCFGPSRKLATLLCFLSSLLPSALSVELPSSERQQLNHWIEEGIQSDTDSHNLDTFLGRYGSGGSVTDQELSRLALAIETFQERKAKDNESQNTLSNDVKLSRVASYWNHNGSIMGLLAQGNNRVFIYVKPRAGLQALVEPGTAVFFGKSDGATYTGTARRFSPGLQPIEYAVSGPIEKDGQRVMLKGKAIARNSDGSTRKTFEDVLTFDLMSAKETSRDQTGPLAAC